MTRCLGDESGDHRIEDGQASIDAESLDKVLRRLSEYNSKFWYAYWRGDFGWLQNQYYVRSTDKHTVHVSPHYRALLSTRILTMSRDIVTESSPSPFSHLPGTYQCA